MKVYLPVDYFKHAGYIPTEQSQADAKERFNEKLEYQGKSKASIRGDDVKSNYSKSHVSRAGE
jgi:hypothetical protein